MKQLEEIYKESFFGKRYKLKWRAPIICDAIESTFNLPRFSKIIDVGCANGELVEEFRKRHFSSYGIEGSSCMIKFAFSDRIFIYDLRQDSKNLEKLYPNKYDLCISLEVAEHIEEEFSDNYVDTLCSLSDMVLLSAAPPGAKGHYHVNCQKKRYWERKFLDRGFSRSRLKEGSFKKGLEKYKEKKGISGYYNHIMIFRSMQ